MDLPKLREVEAFAVTVSGKKMIGLRDPMNYSSEVVAVPQQLYPLLLLLDGQHSVVDIQAEYMRRFGELIFRETIDDVLKVLDAGLFLDSDNFRRKREEIENEFKQSPLRQALLAGKSYDASPEALDQQIQQFFTHEEGPGLPEKKPRKTHVKGIIAPHIDFQRGGPCFAWAYKDLAERADADVYIIFGTAHTHTVMPFVATHKDFETPYGTLPCNRELVRLIQKSVSYDLFRDEFVHRGEHSIEFQTVFLRYLFRDKKEISIVPILCGSFHEMVASRISPAEDARIREFVKAVKNAVKQSGARICCIAGADLAHVGPRFGDVHPISDGFLKLLKADDLRMLEPLERADANGFFSAIQADGDRRKICGLPPIYTMLSVMEATRGKLLKYQQWPDPQGTVTFASMAFY